VVDSDHASIDPEDLAVAVVADPDAVVADADAAVASPDTSVADVDAALADAHRGAAGLDLVDGPGDPTVGSDRREGVSVELIADGQADASSGETDIAEGVARNEGGVSTESGTAGVDVRLDSGRRLDDLGTEDDLGDLGREDDDAEERS
jgi:hypothetical protein